MPTPNAHAATTNAMIHPYFRRENFIAPTHDSVSSAPVRLSEQLLQKRRQNPALDSSPSSWLRSDPQFYAGEVSRARLYAETLVSLEFNRTQVSASSWQRRPAPELSPPCR